MQTFLVYSLVTLPLSVESYYLAKIKELLNYVGAPHHLLYGSDWPISVSDLILSLLKNSNLIKSLVIYSCLRIRKVFLNYNNVTWFPFTVCSSPIFHKLRYEQMAMRDQDIIHNTYFRFIFSLTYRLLNPR